MDVDGVGDTLDGDGATPIMAVDTGAEEDPGIAADGCKSHGTPQ